MPAQKMKHLKDKYGDLNELIPVLVNQYGQAEAARQLGLSTAGISKWLKRNGYRLVMRYERVESEELAS